MRDPLSTWTEGGPRGMKSMWTLCPREYGCRSLFPSAEGMIQLKGVMWLENWAQRSLFDSPSLFQTLSLGLGVTGILAISQGYN